MNCTCKRCAPGIGTSPICLHDEELGHRVDLEQIEDAKMIKRSKMAAETKKPKPGEEIVKDTGIIAGSTGTADIPDDRKNADGVKK